MLCFRYFDISEDSGMLTVKRSLTLDQTKPSFYIFEIIAQDLGDPVSQSDSAIVRINVERGYREGIGFDSAAYLWEVMENTLISQGMTE